MTVKGDVRRINSSGKFRWKSIWGIVLAGKGSGDMRRLLGYCPAVITSASSRTKLPASPKGLRFPKVLMCYGHHCMMEALVLNTFTLLVSMVHSLCNKCFKEMHPSLDTV